jgi:hypothetical protein
MAEPLKNDSEEEKKVSHKRLKSFLGALPSGKRQNFLEPQKILQTFFFLESGEFDFVANSFLLKKKDL